MRAAQVVELKQAPEPTELEGGGAIRIEAVALNPLDIAVGAGSFYGGHPPLPYVPGCEASGRARDGRQVYLFGGGRGMAKDGFLAEQVDAEPELQIELPEETDPALAVAAGIAGVAGWVPVAWRANLVPDDRVLVLGGTGVVGRIAAQAATLLGAAHVVAVGRGDLHRIEEEFAEDGFTVCIDPVWGEPVAGALQYAKRHARIVHVGQSGGPEAPLKSADVRGKELTIIGHSNFALSRDELRRAYLEVLDHLRGGRIEVPLARYPLDRVAEAWERQRSGPRAKVVIEL